MFLNPSMIRRAAPPGTSGLGFERLAAYGLTPAAVVGELQSANSRAVAGPPFQPRQPRVQGSRGGKVLYPSGGFAASRRRGSFEPPGLPCATWSQKLEDGPAEPDSYVVHELRCDRIASRCFLSDGR